MVGKSSMTAMDHISKSNRWHSPINFDNFDVDSTSIRFVISDWAVCEDRFLTDGRPHYDHWQGVHLLDYESL